MCTIVHRPAARQRLPSRFVLANQIRKARLTAGLTQEELASRAHVSREYVNYIERGKREPTVAIFVRLCRAMNVHAPDLLERAMRSTK
jgi:transcriptional regulator with XRE-family HTH domain